MGCIVESSPSQGESKNPMLHLQINDQAYEFPDSAAGENLLQVLLSLGFDVPHLCHDARLKPAAVCRRCAVKVAGESRLQMACTLRLRDGLSIQTQQASPDWPSREPAADLFHDDTHPYIGVDMSRCVLCLRCVRICDEVQGQSVWHALGRGDKTQIRPGWHATLLQAGCVSCGACSNTCPTGALFDKQTTKPIEQWVQTTCPYCGTGCQMEVGSIGHHVRAVRPAPIEHSPVNRGHLCAKGRYAFDFVNAPDRILHPMIRKANKWHRVSWDEAMDEAARRLKNTLSRHGPDAVGFLGSARATNEDNYLIQKFARMVVGTHNVDNCARVCHGPTAAALKHMLGTGAATNTFDDIERASLIMVVGCNPTSNHPIVGARIRQAVKNGAKLIVIDPRRIPLTEVATHHLPVIPGGNIPLLHAMAHTIIEAGGADLPFIAQRVEGYEAFTRFVQNYSPERMAPLCGVPASLIREAAHLYATCKPALCFHGLGVTEHFQGTEGVMALVNLALLTGNLGCPGSGINPLRGQNNVQGSAHMGCNPDALTGGQPLSEPSVRKRFEQVWGAPLPVSRGLSLMEMMDAAHAGTLHALWVMGYDIAQTLADSTTVAQALRNLDLLMVQDMFLTETAKEFAHLFFPVASPFEREGTFMNSDRRVQRVRAVVPPPGEARPDGWIIQELAKRLGGAHHFKFDNGDQSVWDEVRTVWPAGAGLTYERIERTNLHWPCPDTQHPGTPILHTEAKAAQLACVAPLPPPSIPDKNFPFLLTTGRNLIHFNSGTMTRRTPQRLLQSTDHLDISTEDAQRLGLNEEDRVVLSSQHGETTLPIHISIEIMPGMLYATFHDPASRLNRVTSPMRDRMTGTPAYKVTAVNLRKSVS